MWLDEGEESRWRGAARLTLLPASGLVGAGALLHRALYARGVLRRRALPMRVISVGSLVAGCAGVTATAAWVANALHRRGHRVALAARGTAGARRRRDAVLVVSDGRYVKSRVEIAGASAMVLAAHSPGIPVLSGCDRFQLGVRASAAFGTEVLVLEDGFQCHSLQRELDIVAVDARSGFGNCWPRPSGPLREPIRALATVGAVAVIDGPLEGKDQEALRRFGSNALRFDAHRKPVALRPLSGGAVGPPEALAGAAVGLISSLTRPTSLRDSVERLGAKVVTERNFRDHHRYGPRDMRYLYRNAPLWVTTEEDAIQINPDWIGRADVRVLSIELEIAQEASVLDWLEGRLGQSIAHPGRGESGESDRGAGHGEKLDVSEAV